MDAGVYTITGFVDKCVSLYPHRTYLREKVDGVWTQTSYRAVRRESRILAAGFMALGLEKGDRVALISEGRNAWVLTELGILYAGGVNVPLSFKLDSDRDIEFRINHSGARFVVASASQISKIRRVRGNCAALEKVIVIDDEEMCDPSEMPFCELRRLGVEFLRDGEEKLVARTASINPDDYANITYTSGTTDDPKGVVLTHRNLVVNTGQCNSVVKTGRKWTMLVLLPLDHCFAHVAGMYFMMSNGGSIATVPCGRTVVTMLKNIPGTIKEVRPHLMLSVPAVSRNFRKNIEAAVKHRGVLVENTYRRALGNAMKYNREYYNAGKPFRKLWWRGVAKPVLDLLAFWIVRRGFGGRMKFFIGGGAMLDLELERYFYAIGMPIFQGYGLSEASPVVSANSRGTARFGSCGPLVEGLQVRICDENGETVPNGVKGEIQLRGENVMAGYWNNPAATSQTIVDGWLHTGDRGYLLAEDPRYLYVTGRTKSLLISSDGEKYSPEGYEGSLVDMSDYIDAAVLHNNQSVYTVVIIVPSTKALSSAVRARGIDPASVEGKKAMLDILQSEVDSYRKGGSHEGLFPEKWLPGAIIVADEPFTEENGMLNTTSKLVRRNVEKHYASRIEYSLTAEGKQLYNKLNLKSL